MRRLLLAIALLASGCAADSPPEQKPTPGDAPTEPAASGGSSFDAQAWLAAAREIGPYPEAGTPEATREAELATQLESAFGWKRACDTYVDPTTGETVYDPVDEDALSGVRGTLDVAPVSPTEAIVAVTCYFGAYQGSYALLHINGDQAHLLRAPALDETSRPIDAEQTTFGEPDWEGLARGTFVTFMKGRGLGDCGERITFAFGDSEMLAIREVRARECSDDIPDPLPPPSEWPVVYSAR